MCSHSLTDAHSVGASFKPALCLLNCVFTPARIRTECQPVFEDPVVVRKRQRRHVVYLEEGRSLRVVARLEARHTRPLPRRRPPRLAGRSRNTVRPGRSAARAGRSPPASLGPPHPPRARRGPRTPTESSTGPGGVRRRGAPGRACHRPQTSVTAASLGSSKTATPQSEQRGRGLASTNSVSRAPPQYWQNLGSRCKSPPAPAGCGPMLARAPVAVHLPMACGAPAMQAGQVSLILPRRRLPNAHHQLVPAPPGPRRPQASSACCWLHPQWRPPRPGTETQSRPGR